MRIQLLESFLDIVESENITRSAERLNITQPALSKQINALEDYLGIKLFTRTIKGVVLTEEGEVFLPFAKEIIATLENGKSSLKKMKRNRGVTLGTLPSLALTVLDNKEFLQHCTIDEENSRFITTPSTLISLFNKDNIDMLVLDSIYKNKIDCKYECNLFIDPIYAIVPNSMRFSKQSKISVSQLESFEFITYKEEMLSYYSMKTILREKNIEEYISYNVPSIDLLIQMIKKKSVCTLLPGLLAEQINSNEVIKLPITESIYKRISIYTKNVSLYKFLNSKALVNQIK